MKLTLKHTYIPILILCLSLCSIPIFGQFIDCDNPCSPAQLNKSCIKPPIAELQEPFKNYTVEAEVGKTITVHDDTQINIPPNAFVDSAGNIVKGKVDIEYREFMNPLDIFLSGIPMTVQENGKEEFFQSAGMVEFKANKNGIPVYPNPNNENITIELTSNQTGTDYNQYVLDEKTGEWMETGPDVVKNITKVGSKIFDGNIPYSKRINLNGGLTLTEEALLAERKNSRGSRISTALGFIGGSPSMTNGRTVVFDKSKRIITIPPHVSILKSGDKKWVQDFEPHLQFTINSVQAPHERKDMICIPNHLHSDYIKVFAEFGVNTSLVWVYNGVDEKYAAELLGKIKKVKKQLEIDTIPDFVLSDIQIHPNPESDDYLMQFMYDNDTSTINVFPIWTNSTIETPIRQGHTPKRAKEFMKYVETDYNLRLVEWRKIESEYSTGKAEFEKNEKINLAIDEEIQKARANKNSARGKLILQDKISGLQEELFSNNQANSINRIGKNKTRRSLSAITFGVCNIDRIMKSLDETRPVAFNMKSGMNQIFEKVFVLDQTNNAVLSYFAYENIRFNSKAENSLIVTFEDGSFATVKPASFKEAVAQSKGKELVFSMQHLLRKSITKTTLSDALAIN